MVVTDSIALSMYHIPPLIGTWFISIGILANNDENKVCI